MKSTTIKQEAVSLLQRLITIPSFSKQEEGTAAILVEYLKQWGAEPYRVGNNVYAIAKGFNPLQPTLLLNSHHDTVKPNAHYTRDPFSPHIEEGKLYGLGSNDAGASLVALLASFLLNSSKKSNWNLIIAATAEEEISGTGGIEALLQDKNFIEQTKGCFLQENIHPHTCAIVGEPTLLQMAIAERGLLVLDGVAQGKPGHAAREEGENALYHAMDAIQTIRNISWKRKSSLLGPVKCSTTVIETENKAHNIVPASCHFVVDVRVNEQYSFQEVIDILQSVIPPAVQLKPRSTRLRSSLIPLDHPLVKVGLANQLSYYGSPTTSDKALLPFPALKLGPGNSARSHSADEWVGVDEIENGVDLYCILIDQLTNSKLNA